MKLVGRRPALVATCALAALVVAATSQAHPARRGAAAHAPCELGCPIRGSVALTLSATKTGDVESESYSFTYRATFSGRHSTYRNYGTGEWSGTYDQSFNVNGSVDSCHTAISGPATPELDVYGASEEEGAAKFLAVVFYWTNDFTGSSGTTTCTSGGSATALSGEQTQDYWPRIHSISFTIPLRATSATHPLDAAGVVTSNGVMGDFDTTATGQIQFKAIVPPAKKPAPKKKPAAKKSPNPRGRGR